MPSTIVRPEPSNLHDSAESTSSSSHYNKPQKGSIITSPFLHTANMQRADQEVDDHLHAGLPHKPAAAAPSVEAKAEEEAAALLHHMHLVHRPDRQINNDPPADPMDMDHADNRIGAAQMEADHGILQGPAAAAAGGGRENSGSSDASAAYFSGDSDLTAEPIMGSCASDHDNEADGAKSSNSRSSSTPVSNGVIGGNAYSVNLPSEGKKVYSSTDHDAEEVGLYVSKMASATTASLAGTISTAAGPAWVDCHPFQGSYAQLQGKAHKLQAQDHQINVQATQRSSSPLAYANGSGRNNHNVDNWLELRLGFDNSHKIQTRELPIGGAVLHKNDVRGDGQSIMWNEPEVAHDGIASTEPQQPVTLQLLPEERLRVADHPCDRAAAASAMTPIFSPPQDQPPASLYSSSLYPHAYFRPSSSILSHNGLQVDMNPALIGNVGAPPSVRPLLRNQANSSARPVSAQTPSEQFSEQLVHISRESNYPSYFQHPSMLSRPLYDATTRVHGHMQECTHDERRWVVPSSAVDMRPVPGQAAPAASTANIPSAKCEIYRPTASLAGWPGPGSALVSDGGVEGRPWSAGGNSVLYTAAAQAAQLQNGNSMSWQGLLRSMGASHDPQLLHAHAMRDHALNNMHQYTNSFNNGAVSETSTAGILRRRHYMYAPPSSGHAPGLNTAPAPAGPAPKRLRLASSRCRSSDLWFSLQETDYSLEEKGPDPYSNRSVQKLYLRIRDGKMQISVVKSYLIKKLGSGGSRHYDADEVEITCRGQVLSPNLTIQHVRDSIWLNHDVGLEVIGFQSKTSQTSNPQNRVMALFYQRLQSQTLTLNLLKL